MTILKTETARPLYPSDQPLDSLLIIHHADRFLSLSTNFSCVLAFKHKKKNVDLANNSLQNRWPGKLSEGTLGMLYVMPI